MSTDQSKATLELFVEKLDKLERSTFLKKLLSNSQMAINYDHKSGLKCERVGPNEENIDAFVLTFRFFIQNNESISISNLQKIFDSEAVTISEGLEFTILRNELNLFLSQSCGINIEKDITNSELMDTFIYGGLSHANPKKKKKYDLWLNKGGFATELLYYEFTMILFKVLWTLKNIKKLCLKILDRNF